MPPWSGDYHFNINVQECYAPADQGTRLAHLRPLFDMIWSWRAQLPENAGLFVEIEDGLMLPHGVDDRGMNMGGFWTGTVDHGCTAWVAKMMFDYWRFGGEKKFLKTVAFPFMVGALRVYEAMLERTGDGSSYRSVCRRSIAARLSMLGAAIPPNWVNTVLEDMANKGRIIKAATLGELARRAGIHAGALQATIDRYNSDVANGREERSSRARTS